MSQVFTIDQMNLINKGAFHHNKLKNLVKAGMTANNDTTIISSCPGLGKSYETEQFMNTLTNKPLFFAGTPSMPAYIVDITTAVYLANNNPLFVVQDDCDVLFLDNNTNTTKKMFDQTKTLKYNKVTTGLKAFCNELQWEAIQHFTDPKRAGFEVPLHNVNFLILTNRHLPTINEVNALPNGSKKHSVQTDLHAIRRRVNYQEITMSDDELWGYVAYTTLNSQICQNILPAITQTQVEQILIWCFYNWKDCTERNLSLIEKLTKDIKTYPNNYLDMWNINYVQ
jgi:hypothetical protein